MTRPVMASLARRPAAWLLLALTALAPIGGCNCNATRSVTPIILPPLSAVVVTPATDTLRVGDIVQFTAVAYDTLAQPVAGAGFAWSSGNTAVFTVNPTGRVTAVSEGVDTLFAQTGGRTGIAIVFVFRDTGWVTQTSTTGRNLNGVFFLPDGQSGWAVGSGGVIVHTSDAGAHWSTQVSNTSNNLNGVWFTNATDGWAVGSLGTVLRTIDAGATWVRLTVSSSDNLMDVCFADADTGFAVGSSGAVLRTIDGVAWQKTSITGTVLQSVSFAGPRNGWIVGDGGKIFGTTDSGIGWTLVQPAITTTNLNAVWRRSAESAWAVGDQGVAPLTTGTSAAYGWTLGSAGAVYTLEGVCFPDPMIGYAVGASGAGAILRTDDGGSTWQAQAAHASRTLNDVYFVDALRGWAVGDGGIIVHTSLGGGQ